MRLRSDRRVENRAVRSDVSTVGDTLDAMDNVDVVTALPAIRDQGRVSGDFQVCSPGVLQAFAVT
jgi:hypothetical protein